MSRRATTKRGTGWNDLSARHKHLAEDEARRGKFLLFALDTATSAGPVYLVINPKLTGCLQLAATRDNATLLEAIEKVRAEIGCGIISPKLLRAIVDLRGIRL